jgi:two-component system, NtrC family, response regulator AtoC
VDRGSSSHDPTSSVLELAIAVSGGVTVAALPARGSVLLGRGDDCDVRLEHSTVSRRHAILHLGPELRIQDLGSQNGTFVRVTPALSESGSTHPLRKLASEIIEISVGERVNLGAVPLVVRRAAAARYDAASPDLVGVLAPAMQKLYEQVARAAQSPISVLLLGEVGVGKEAIARAIHDRSPRAHLPFIGLDCAVLAPVLLESELFGHDQSAVTGAGQDRPGVLERADGGTIFLDEVGALPLPMQIKLLRLLEDRRLPRLGGGATRQLDLRFIAATQRDLADESAHGTFRPDLYFRLNGISLTVPPLRERTAEIVPIAEHLLVAASHSLDQPHPLRFSPDALDCLERHAWPGNLRELRDVVERAAILAEGNVVLPADLPARVTGTATGPVRRLRSGSTTHTVPTSALPSGAAERRRILEALDRCEGNQTRAAKLLGISLRTLVARLAEYEAAGPRKRP